MKRILFLILFPCVVFAQNTIGLPDIMNHTKQVYKAGLQNWDIKQDRNGIIYVANNEGLLSFDGSYWHCMPLPNKTIVRAIEIANDGKIYAGGQDELGYFSPTTNGVLKYHSLVEKIEGKDRSFGDVWDIVRIHKHVFFRTSSKIFKLSDGKITTYYPNSEWSFLGSAQGKLYAHDYKTGFKVFENQVWVPLQQKGLPSASIPTAIVGISGGRALITTLKNGLFELNNQVVRKLTSKNNTLFENERIYSAIGIDAKNIALATTNGGAYIINEGGTIIQSFSKKEGLQNNNVLSIFSDKEHNLWLGLDNGIDFVAYNSPIKQINPLLQNASGYTAMVFQNEFWMGTSNGLYSVPLQNTADLSFSKGEFNLVKNTKGQTWNLTKLNNQLFLGHHEGAFTIQNHQAKQLADGKGYWHFLSLSNTMPSTEVLAGTYSGLVSFSAKNGRITKQQDPIGNFTESSRFITLDENGAIWVSHPYHGLFKIERKANNQIVTKSYSTQNGLPSTMNNHVFNVNSQILVGSTEGIYEYDKNTDRFKPAAAFKELIGKQSIRYLKEDDQGNIWFIHEKTVGVLDVTGNKPRVIYLPELSGKLLSGFEHIYPYNPKNILIGGEKGFFIVNYEKYKANIPKLQVNIRLVKISNQTDSVLFGGYRDAIRSEDTKTISQQWKTIRFEYSSALFGSQTTLEYSYRLKGFDKQWSEWSQRTEKEFTSLSPGNYTFEVKVRNNLGNESPISSFQFEVLPPWYLTIWAKFGYGALFYIGVLFLHRWYKRKLRLQQAKHEVEQQKLQYIHDLERAKTESELVNLRNEKLEAEINLMNTELASAAMHLVKKGEVLAKSKEELSKALKVIDHPQAVSELKKMMRNLNEDEKMDQEWDNFSKHFDKVHSDFLMALKKEHPSITANELKLCAYLRMNLSTKEIAQLTNISVRGVEIGRYRLRKKLKLAPETTLFDYLLSFKH